MMAMSKGESDGEFLKADWRLIAPLRLLGTVVSAEAKNDEERGGCGGRRGLQGYLWKTIVECIIVRVGGGCQGATQTRTFRLELHQPAAAVLLPGG
ncbi:hypothetical protein TcYC6_0003910 [Trypanosoma cruzi]|nr:hypothetical protein TcYC6_0003910 [Trypanosoma cruzi]